MGLFGGIGKAFSGAVKGLTGPVGGLALGALGAISAAKKQGQADQRSRQALDLALREFNARGPLRDRALQLALAPRPGRENLSALFFDPGNPFNRVAAPRSSPGSVGPSDQVPTAPLPPPASLPAGRGGLQRTADPALLRRALGGRGLR